MFKIFRTSSKKEKGDKKKKVAKSNKNQPTNDINEEVNSTPDGKSVENTNNDTKRHTLQRKDSIPIGIKWITQPSPHIKQDQDNSTNSSADELRENSSTPSRGSQLTESRVSQLTDSRVSQLTESRVSQLTENSDVVLREKNINCLNSSNTKQEVENSLPNDNSNRSSLNPEITSNGSWENISNNIKEQAPLQDDIITNIDIKQQDNELLHKAPQNILELLLAKFDKFEENIMVEINCIKESQEKQEKRLSDIQSRQEEVNNALNLIISTQFSSTVKEIEVEEQNLSELKNVLPTIQEVDINVDQSKEDVPEADPQSPTISSSLMTSTVSPSVTSHTSEQPQSQDSSTVASESTRDSTDVIVSTCEPLSVSLPMPSPVTTLSLCNLPEAQQKALSIMAVHNSMSQLEHLRSPISSRMSAAPAVPSPFRTSSNPPIKHSPPTKPKRLSLQIPMLSSSPSQSLSEDSPVSCPLRRTIEWPEHSPVIHSPVGRPPVIHSPFAASKRYSELPLRKVQDRDRRMFITITP